MFGTMDERRVGALALGLALVGAACDEMPTYEKAVSRIEGQVWFLGPAGDVPVTLYGVDESGARLQAVTETRTDEGGAYVFYGVEGLRSYRVEADLAGVRWVDPHAETEGAFGAGLVLSAPVEELAIVEERRAQVTPLTTLLVAVADAWRSSGLEVPTRDARAAFATWLTFDPVETEIGDARSGLAGAGVHRLVLEGLAALAARASDAAGVRPGTALSAETLLGALVDDAMGPTPPGFFDGLGPEGPVELEVGPGRYRVAATTLRDELAEAVRERLRVEPWTVYSEGDAARLLQSLRCSPSAIFESCDRVDEADRTPPSIEAPTPAPETPLSGVVVIEVSASDRESGVRSLRLERVPDEGPPVELSDRDDRPGVANVLFDTTTLTGFWRAEFRAVAVNRAGGEGILEFGYPLANLEAGELVGHVVKGPAIAVEVRASALRPSGDESELARAWTEADGLFRLRIQGWKGPVVLRAKGTADHPGGAGSGFWDEARGRALSWDLDQTLTTLVPDFDPESRNNRPVVVTPLGDLAWTRARGLAAARGVALLDAYHESLGLLAAHFGLAGPESVLHVRPAPADEAVTPPPTEAARYMLALACMSRQALDVAAELSPEAVDGFTPLHLLEAYRRDVAGDGDFDGTDGLRGVLVEHGERSRPLGDPLRAELAFACARWLGQPDNPTGLDVLLVAQWLQDMALDDSALFDPGVAPAPFDDAPPEVSVRLEAGARGAVLGARVAGEVDVHLEAMDRAGVLTIDAMVEGAPPAALEVTRAVPDAERPAATPRAEWVGRLNARLLADGPTALAYVITDALGNTLDGQSALVVDNTPPALAIEVAAGEGGARAGASVAGTLDVLVRAEDEAGVEALEVGLRGEGAGALEGERDGDTWRGRLRSRSLPDGPAILEVSAVDAVGNAAEATAELRVDHAAPEAALEVVATEAGRVVGERVAGVVEVRVTAEDAAGEARVEPAPGPLDTRDLDDGPHTLRYVVADPLGNEVELEQVIVVDNTGPRVALSVSPGPGGAVAGASVTGEVWIDAALEDASEIAEARFELPAGGFERGEAAAGLRTAELPDGPVEVRAVVTDALGNMSAAALPLRVDNTAPEVRLLADSEQVNEIGGRWYTRAERLTVEVQIEDATPLGEARFELGEEALGLEGEALPVDLPAEDGTWTLRAIVEDALGHRTEVSRLVTVDRTPPALEHIETAFVDERALDAGRALAGAPTLTVRAGEPVRFTKWQDHWGAGDDNPIVVRWRATDAAPDALRVRWRAGSGPVDLPVAEEYAVELTADALGIDPIGRPPAPGTPAEIVYEAVDPAGNVARASVPGTLDVIPPPVEIVAPVGVPDPGWARLEEITLWENTLQEVFEGGVKTGVLLKQAAVRNPHGIAVRVSLEVPERLHADVGVGTWMWGRSIQEMLRDRVDHRGQPLDIEDERLFEAVEFEVGCVEHHWVSVAGQRSNFVARLEAPELVEYAHRGQPVAILAFGITNWGGTCEELTPAETGVFQAEAPIAVVPSDGALDDDGMLVLGPGETREVAVVAGTLVADAEVVAELLGARAAMQGREWFNARDIQSGFGAMFEMFMDRAGNCPIEFAGEEGWRAPCQAPDLWFGHRVQAITDLRVWAGDSAGPTDWPLARHSVEGDLRAPAGTVQGCSPTRHRAEQLQ